MKRTLILLILISTVIIIHGSAQYLRDPENRDISNNNAVFNVNRQDAELKYISPDSITYYILRPGGDTVENRRDSLGIYRIEVHPSGLGEGEYWIEVLGSEKQKELDFEFTVKSSVNIAELILKVLLGLVFFMMGLQFSSKGLSRISGYRMKEILWNLSDSPIKGGLAGIVLTMMLQSSTAFSVMITSFVSDGLIGVVGAVSLLAGSAIGTSVIVQIIAFNISVFSIILIITGFAVYDRVKKYRDLGTVIMGFGLIFFAIQTMSGAMMPVRDTVFFSSVIDFLQNNLILLFVLTSIFTFSVHSSAVVIALVMGLSATGKIPFSGAVVMIAAANLGTTFTATMASFRGNRQAKYVTIINAVMKLAVGIVFVAIMFSLESVFTGIAQTSRGIANLHLIFNISFALIVLMLMPLIAYIGRKIKEGEQTIVDRTLIGESMNTTPTLAMGHIFNEIVKMAEIAHRMVDRSFDVFKTNDNNLRKELIALDDEIDQYEKEITLLLVKLSEEELTSGWSAKIKSMLFIVDEIEHIGDIVSKNLMVSAKKKIENNYFFSDEGFSDIKLMYSEVLETVRNVLSLMTIFNEEEAEQLLKRREKVLATLNRLHAKHLGRMQKDIKESIETSTLHLDILSDYERINFHSYKICFYIIEKEKIK
ncbi:MAG: Na/Pi cotransporter family protein [bacterium]